MPIFDNIGGVQRQVAKSYSNINGVYREDSKVYDNVNGVWREAYSALSVGDTYVLGGYNWTVVDINAITGQAVLLLKPALTSTKLSNGTGLGSFWGFTSETGSQYGDSARVVCLDFYFALSADAKAKIVSVNNTTYNDGGTAKTAVDNVWLPSISQLSGVGTIIYSGVTAKNEGTIFQLFAQNNTAAYRASFYNASMSWTRTLKPLDDNYSVYVNTTGGWGLDITASNSTNLPGIRPCVLIIP